MSAADAAPQEPQQDLQEAVTTSAVVAALETLCQAAKTQGVLRRASKQARRPAPRCVGCLSL